jgi:hypothetical protein
VQVTQLTPRSASYRGNRSVRGLERVLPADWLSSHEFRGDEVEVYTLGDALVLLPGREPQQRFSMDFKRLTVGWARVDWWRFDSPSEHG